MRKYLDFYTKYKKLQIEHEILQEELIDLKETMKELLFNEIVIAPGEKEKLKKENIRLREKIKILRESKQGK